MEEERAAEAEVTGFPKMNVSQPGSSESTKQNNSKHDAQEHHIQTAKNQPFTTKCTINMIVGTSKSQNKSKVGILMPSHNRWQYLGG